MAYAYFKRAASERVRHVELFFDPQSHTGRGVAWNTFMAGLTSAVSSARAELGVHCNLIMCVMRCRGPDAAMATLLEVPFPLPSFPLPPSLLPLSTLRSVSRSGVGRTAAALWFRGRLGASAGRGAGL